VSQHDVMTAAGIRVLARCGLQLRIAAVFEIPCGKGRVVVSRLQLRGRLLDGTPGGSLFARRTDPVLQRYLLNLVKYALTPEP